MSKKFLMCPIKLKILVFLDYFTPFAMIVSASLRGVYDEAIQVSSFTMVIMPFLIMGLTAENVFSAADELEGGKVVYSSGGSVAPLSSQTSHEFTEGRDINKTRVGPEKKIDISIKSVREIINLATLYEEDEEEGDLSKAKGLFDAALVKAKSKSGSKDEHDICVIQIHLAVISLWKYKDERSRAQAAKGIIEAAIMGAQHPILQGAFDADPKFAEYVGRLPSKAANPEKATKILLHNLFPDED